MCNARPSLTVLILSLAVFSIYPSTRGQQPSATEADTSLPSTLVGRWQVTQVLVDPELFKSTWYSDDPRIKGRLVSIAPRKITANLSGVSVCIAPVINRRRQTPGALIRETMSHIRADVPTPEDYRLPLASGAELDVLWIRCKISGDIGPSGAPGRDGFNWLLLLPDGRLAVRWWDYDAIAILNRLPSETMPNPSFDCAKAATPAERTICGSVDLSAFDRSVAEAYTNAVARRKKKGDAEGVRNLQKEQTESLRERSACGTDEECLRESMRVRIEKILDPSYR